ncbi:MAG: hypothetical protein JNL30_14670 [Rubrivivax sp.]|nr:hypothetical protein [Rubrivivax sp.]
MSLPRIAPRPREGTPAAPPTKTIAQAGARTRMPSLARCAAWATGWLALAGACGAACAEAPAMASAVEPAASAPAAGRTALRGTPAGLRLNTADLFAPRSWAAPPPPKPRPAPTPPPPPPPAAAPPPAPTAPPLPFTFVGFIETEPGAPKVLLAMGDELIVARRGDELAGRRYRLAGFTSSALEFVYLPLQQPQRLQLPTGGR